jgi:hypothetical protein
VGHLRQPIPRFGTQVGRTLSNIAPLRWRVRGSDLGLDFRRVAVMVPLPIAHVGLTGGAIDAYKDLVSERSVPAAHRITLPLHSTLSTSTMSPSLPTRKIADANVTALGFGAMGMSAFYGSGAVESDEARFKASPGYVIAREVDLADACMFIGVGRRVRERVHVLGHRGRIHGFRGASRQMVGCPLGLSRVKCTAEARTGSSARANAAIFTSPRSSGSPQTACGVTQST